MFDFFSRAENLEKITPPWLGFHILSRLPVEMKSGAIIEYKLRVHGFPLKWITEIERWDPPYEFSDVQVKGPYKLWHHTHRFMHAGGGTEMEDMVEYTLPLGPLGRWVHQLQVAKDLEDVFDYREREVRTLLGRPREIQPR